MSQRNRLSSDGGNDIQTDRRTDLPVYIIDLTSCESQHNMPRSDIWKYFDLKILKNGKKEANCKDCPKIFVFSGSTTTLWRHIQTVHTVHPLPSNSSIKQESQKRKAQEIEVEIKSSHQTKNLRRMTINQKLQN